MSQILPHAPKRKPSLAHELSLKQLFTDAVLYNAALGSLIVGTLYINAEIWLNDYPPDIKEKYGPMSQRGKRHAALMAIPFFGIMLGGLIWSNRRQKRQNGGFLSFSAAFTNAYTLILSGWLFDLTILDWLMFVRHTPDFVVLPGTEGMAGYNDAAFHLKEHIKALPMLAGLALIIAMLTASRPWSKRSAGGNMSDRNVPTAISGLHEQIKPQPV